LARVQNMEQKRGFGFREKSKSLNFPVEKSKISKIFDFSLKLGSRKFSNNQLGAGSER
jgi:hypothetical protein